MSCRNNYGNSHGIKFVKCLCHLPLVIMLFIDLLLLSVELEVTPTSVLLFVLKQNVDLHC